MSTIRFKDFDLAIETIDPTHMRFRATVLHSPAGLASCEFTLPFTGLEWENYVLKLSRTRRGTRSLNSPEGKAAVEFGSKLYDTVFQGEVRTCLQQSLKAGIRPPEQGLRLRLRLQKAQALVDLPWEFLYDVENRRFFSHSNLTPLVRYLELAETAVPLPVQLPFKVLAMIANAKDLPGLNVEAEWAQVQKALAGPIQNGWVKLTRLTTPTWATLQGQLRQEQYHIFHFVGHGAFDMASNEGVLMFENEDGLSNPVAASALGALLHDHRSLRLVLLNACEGARAGLGDPFAGVAQQLVVQGIPAVIAMQFPITDVAAIAFAQALYAALADRYSIDAALAEARKAILGEQNNLEWATPVLYMRAQDGQVFNTTIIPAPAPQSQTGRTTVWQRSIRLRVEPAEITVQPGNEVQIRALMANHGAEQQFFKMKLTGIPAEWVSVSPSELVELKSLDVATATFTIHPPASAKTRAGRFRIFVEATNLRLPTKPLQSKATLKISSFGEVRTELHPNRAAVGETFELLVKNRRNRTERVQFTCLDESQTLAFDIPTAQAEIPAGDNARLSFSARLRQTRWFGGRREHPFQVKLEYGNHAGDLHQGVAVSWGRIRIPPWATKVLMMGLIIGVYLM